jgi:uncharacterized DUF497 family protein
MEFEWDEAKRRANVAKHGLDFVDCTVVWAKPLWRGAVREVDGEIRQLVTGVLRDIFVTVIFTERGGRVRIISMRRARDGERREYCALYFS